MCIIFIALKEAGLKTCDAKDVIAIYDKALIDYNSIDASCYVKNANTLLQIACQYFMQKTSTTNIFYGGYHSEDFIKKNQIAYILGAWKWKYTHFVVMNGIGNTKDDVIYDPLGLSFSVKNGELISTRLYCRV